MPPAGAIAADEPTSRARADAAQPPQWFPILSGLWSVAVLIHQAHAGGLTRLTPVDVLLNLAAVWAVLQPQSVWRFLIMLASQLLAWWVQIPFVSNHWVLLALGGISILSAAGVLACTGGRNNLTGERLFDTVAPVLRVELLLLYGFAVLAKLNPAFLDPRQSCATVLWGDLHLYLRFLPSLPWLTPLAGWGTLLAETGIPVLLVLPRTRVVGLVLGGVFHAVLGLGGRFDFSAALLPFYCVFAPPGLPRRVAELARQYPRTKGLWERVQRAARSRFALPAVAVPLLVLMGLSMATGIPEQTVHLLCTRSCKIVWFALTVLLMLPLVSFLRPSRPSGVPSRMFRIRYPILLLGPLLMTLNGLSPYLGLGTEHAFTMFSNLKTEANEWNHYFMPRSMRVFRFQDDLVEIISASDPTLRAAAAKQQGWIYFEFQRYVAAHRQIAVSYVYQEQAHDVRRVGDDPVLSRPPNPILSKLLWFRPVEPTASCQH